MRRTVLVTGVLVSGVLAGCSHSGSPSAAPGPAVASATDAGDSPSPDDVADSPSPSIVPEPPDICAGVDDCHLETATDIDGDGSVDAVAVVGHPEVGADGASTWMPDAKPVLRVRTSTAILTYPVVLTGPVYGRLVIGSTKLDGVPGYELLLGYGTGAHGNPQTVVTLRGGALFALPSPAPYADTTTAEGSWGIDGSQRSNEGWTCLSGGQVERFTAEGVHDPGAPGHFSYVVTHQTWKWTDAGWSPVGAAVKLQHQALAPEDNSWSHCGTFAAFHAYPAQPLPSPSPSPSPVDVSPVVPSGVPSGPVASSPAASVAPPSP